MNQLNQYFGALDHLIEKRHPDQHSLLSMMGVPVAKLMVSWFGSLFAQNLSLQSLFRFWDLLFLEGEVVLFRLALFAVAKKDLRNKTSEDILRVCQRLDDLLEDFEFFETEQKLLSINEFAILQHQFK